MRTLSALVILAAIYAAARPTSARGEKEAVDSPFPVVVDAQPDGTLRYSFINAKGELFKQRFDTTARFSSGLALVSKDKRFGYVNTTGEYAIPPKFRFARAFSEGLAAFQADDRLWGFIDTQGNPIIPARYSEVGDFSEGRAAVFSGISGGYIDPKGNLAIPLQFANATPFANGLAKVADYGGSRTRYINPSGEVVFDAKGYSDVMPFSGSRARVQKSFEVYGYLDKTGNLKIPLKYKSAQDFSEGIAAVSLDGEHWGYIDEDGAQVIEPKFVRREWGESASPCREGLIRVIASADGWSGFVSRTGDRKFQVPATYSCAGFTNGLCFFSDLAKVPKGFRMHTGYLNKAGVTVYESTLTIDDVPAK